MIKIIGKWYQIVAFSGQWVGRQIESEWMQMRRQTIKALSFIGPRWPIVAFPSDRREKIARKRT